MSNCNNHNNDNYYDDSVCVIGDGDSQFYRRSVDDEGGDSYACGDGDSNIAVIAPPAVLPSRTYRQSSQPQQESIVEEEIAVVPSPPVQAKRTSAASSAKKASAASSAPRTSAASNDNNRKGLHRDESKTTADEESGIGVGKGEYSFHFGTTVIDSGRSGGDHTMCLLLLGGICIIVAAVVVGILLWRKPWES